MPEVDLFISYRRAANATHDRWVDVFCDELRNSLAELVGRNVSIWRDTDQLRTSDDWRARLQAAIDEAAIFLAVFSRSYLLSDECRRELDQFLRVMKAGGRKRRIVPVFKQPPNPEVQAPPEVNALQRHEFFHWSPPGSPHWEELAPHGGPAEEREFYSALSRLAQDIMIALEEIEGDQRRRARGRIYLARVAPELESYREKLRADLVSSGFIVVPGNEYLWNAADLQQEIDDDLAEAMLCVHLVNAGASIDPDAARRSRQQLEQAHQAMKARGRPAPLVWLHGRDKPDAAAAALVEAIEGDLANQGVEYWCGRFEDLKTQVYDKLPARTAAAIAPVSVGDAALVVEEAEIGQDGELRSLLAERLRVEPRPVKLGNAAPRDADRAQRTLAACTHALVFWGGQSQDWLDDVLSLPALAGHLSAGTLGVYVAGPATAEKSVFRSARAAVITAGDGSDAALRRFFGIELN